MDETSASSQLEQLKNLCLDERSGEYVSKTELKRRLKIQEKREKRVSLCSDLVIFGFNDLRKLEIWLQFHQNLLKNML